MLLLFKLRSIKFPSHYLIFKTLKMAKLKTEEQYKFGQTNIIPFAGEVKISDKGIIEVDDDVAQDIVNSNIGFSFVEEGRGGPVKGPADEELGDNLGQQESDDLSKQDQDDLGKQEPNEEEEIEKAEAQNTQPSLEDVKAELDKSTLAELKELAKPFPSAEWRNLAKAELIDYLASKTV
jgi:hypothetical protein